MTELIAIVLAVQVAFISPASSIHGLYGLTEPQILVRTFF